MREIGKICRENNLWLHVDGAMSGTAAVCPEFRLLQDGMELADTYASTPISGCSRTSIATVFMWPIASSLIKTLSVLPEYLRNQATESGAVIDYRDWQIPFGRRFRSLKFWFVIRHYGIEGFGIMSASCRDRADRFADLGFSRRFAL